MGYTILKATQDENDDLYVNWSSYVDAPVMWGTEAELVEAMEDTHADPKRFERARRTGTSSHIGSGAWGKSLIVAEMGNTNDQWILPRESLKAFVDRLSCDRIEDKDYQQEVLLDLAEVITYDD